MPNQFYGNISLICPDCGTSLVNHAPNAERYKCTDCDLVLLREQETFKLVRHDEIVGDCSVDEIAFQVTWRVRELVAV